MRGKPTAQQRAYQALDDLLKRKKFENITIGELLEKAQLSRSHFYRLFTDKYDLMHRATFASVEAAFGRSAAENYQDALVESLEIMERTERNLQFHRRFEQEEMFFLFYRVCPGLFTTHIGLADPEQLSPSQRRQLNFLSAGFAMVMKDWVFDGCKEPPRQLAQELEVCYSKQIEALTESVRASLPSALCKDK